MKLITEVDTNACTKLIGGAMLGYCYTNESGESKLEFISWKGKKIGKPLPQPKFIKWNPIQPMCVFAFSDRYELYQYSPTFKFLSYVKEEIHSAFWWNSTLFITTTMDIKAVFPTQKSIESVVLASYDLVRYGSNPERSEDDGLDPIPQPKPKGIISIADVVGDNLYVIDPKSTLHKISLSHPTLKFRMLVVAGQPKQALTWLPIIAEELHEVLTDFLTARGCYDEACQIDTISSIKKLNLCIDHGYIEIGMETIKQIDQYKPDNCKIININIVSLKDLSNYYVKLGCKATEKNNDTITEKCFQRAVELNKSQYQYLILFYVKNQNGTKIEELKAKATNEKNYDMLAMISLYLYDHQSAIQFSKDGLEYSLSVLLNHKNGGQNQKGVIQDWQNHVKQKYVHIPTVNFQ